MQQGDILSRAAANVMETQHDELEHMMEPEKHGVGSEEPKAVKPIDSAGTDDLMKTVNDLIIMGYQPKLSFERDFIGEGMKLLNRFDVPDMVQGS